MIADEKIREAIRSILIALKNEAMSMELAEALYRRGYEDGAREKFLELTTKTSPPETEHKTGDKLLD